MVRHGCSPEPSPAARLPATGAPSSPLPPKEQGSRCLYIDGVFPDHSWFVINSVRPTLLPAHASREG